MSKKPFIFRGKETSYDYGWNDDVTFTFDFGDGDKDFVDVDSDEYFIHCQYCADPNCDHCDPFWFGIWWEHDLTEASELYLTIEEKEEVKKFMMQLMEDKAMYKVKYEDNTGNGDCIVAYTTEEEAEKAIEEDLENVKEFLQSLGYDYGDFGAKTEIWVPGGNEYASWERLWM